MLNIIGLYWRVYKAVQHFEPWGILFAVLGLAISIVAFWLDHEDRVEARTVNAWNLLTTQASGNSGKIAALEYLNRKDGLFCGASGCMITLKKRAPLPAINLAGARCRPRIFKSSRSSRDHLR